MKTDTELINSCQSPNRKCTITTSYGLKHLIKKGNKALTRETSMSHETGKKNM